MKSFYITTPIYYVNAQPHLGHAYSTIVADAAARLRRMMGERALFLTGTDEHGDKIARAAEKKGIHPQRLVDEISGDFRSLWQDLDISHDIFERTTDPAHVAAVQKFLQKIYDAGDIYFGEFGGHYCYGCERFYTEKELVDGLCPQHQAAPEYISEKNYFFRMSKYLPWLKEYIDSHPDLIRPERYRNEALAMLEGGVLEDLCISRPKSRLTWGVELPFDRDYVCYVWFDALVSYIAGIGWPDKGEFGEFWPGEHLIAKDILKPHAIFWPCMLKAAGLPIYSHLDVHGYWLSRDAKMSKSLGNVVEPLAQTKIFGLDAFRYFLLRDMRFGSDASFGEEAVISRINADLANDLGNLFSRVLSMNAKYFSGNLPERAPLEPADEALVELAVSTGQAYLHQFSEMRISKALETFWIFVSAMNKYVDSQAPWSLYKQGSLGRLACVMNVLLAGLRRIAIFMWPVMPCASCRMLGQLGLEAPKPGEPPVVDIWAEAEVFGWLEPVAPLASASSLFPRIEAGSKSGQDAEKKPSTQESPVVASPEIRFESFKEVHMAVGTVIRAEKHPDADRLLRLEIDFGEEKPRQIISGLAEHYAPGDLAGRQVCAVLNLAPRKIRGLVSHGMVLTAENGGQLALLSPDSPVPPGSRIS